MEVDDTPHRVFVSSLDDSSDEEHASDDEDNLIFLPDIEKKMTKIPLHVLKASSSSHDNINIDNNNHYNQTSVALPTGPSTDLVLYQEPKSLTIPEEDDNVRRFVIEAKERIRQRQQGREVARERPVLSKSDGGFGTMRGFVRYDSDVIETPPAAADDDGEDGEGELEYDPDAMDMDI